MLKPLGDRVIVTVDKEEEKTVGGIVLANNAKEKPQTADVVAVGEGLVTEDGKKLPMNVKKGDKVLFDKYSGSTVKYEDNEYLILHEKDIMAVID
ncbi:Co-chaperonin GroES (HSP10) [Companilactobacillus paralimentarius DSM 13238 = JCM 10415]|uniref:Co-chaperonin GroES n=5 Tax=Companilactobacillus TaxID=2767879 RepID=A0ABR5NTF4_9LACO|nr:MULTISPECIES: co-chaperone GroES [Companilactobacillus]KAE9557166.1 molecular chaperone GroES [Companilactobacillus bobalius]KAE9558568.1 molecular chaperone GroES [Companilactobacillus kimchii]KAE9563077.1 molecular chaperone GroES [Companilactobacillus paralimentarius]KRK51692.1 Co-chaperonin GroES (HSP10) [Companilactobacillus kimchii DSM 13961 = JCM 10707]KRK82095.1 Co-chaperonin GroES (HSP10) [Companilactobacillus bobalius DSM 19674]